eukprot:gene17740-19513_t
MEMGGEKLPTWNLKELFCRSNEYRSEFSAKPKNITTEKTRSSTWEKRRNKKRRMNENARPRKERRKQQTADEYRADSEPIGTTMFLALTILNTRILASNNSPPLDFLGRRRDAIIMIDNSNIFIGAREAACAVNPSLGPSIRLGYTVDLEDRRGKDEQRVDEQLHLCIYKVSECLYSSLRVLALTLWHDEVGILLRGSRASLVFHMERANTSERGFVSAVGNNRSGAADPRLASGDGCKGKSTGATSFPDCAIAALEHGWNVEVYSWKHSLSAEWLRIAAKHKETSRFVSWTSKRLCKSSSSAFYSTCLIVA